MTADEAAELLGVPVSVIWSWRTRQRVTPIELIRGKGRAGLVPVYDLEDLRPLAEAYRPRPRHADADGG